MSRDKCRTARSKLVENPQEELLASSIDCEFELSFMC